jgi:prepilin-type N-terminal cleavage/methylation domain-containing protein
MTKPKSQHGFTITELLISVVIIAIGVVGFSTAVGLVSTELWIGQRDTDVSMLVAHPAEALNALPYESVQSGARSEGDYQLAWVVQGSNPKKVVLEATYSRRSGSQVSDTVVIYIPR